MPVRAFAIAAALALGGSAAPYRQAPLPWPASGTGVAAERKAQSHTWWAVEPAQQPGLRLLRAARVRSRLYELTFTTPDVPNTREAVRILLPPPYSSSTRRYPTLYLLHGCCNGPSPGGAQSWTDTGQAEALTRHSGAIVVMPDGGAGSMWIDWRDGEWRYESFVIDQLMPWVDLHLRTIPRRESRGVAGLSMGGYGAMYLAARHPDLFSSSGAFSGIVDLLRPDRRSSTFVDPEITSQQPGRSSGAFGELAARAIDWHGHDPADLAMNLASGIPPFLEYGDPPTGEDETIASRENHSLESALKSAGIRPTVVRLPFRGHSFTVWNDGLKNYLKLAEGGWRQRPRSPDGFSYTSAAKHFSAFNYTVDLARPVQEFATLSGVTADGFRLTGSGRAVLRTAARYAPGGDYLIQLPAGTTLMRADDRGRLTIGVHLGPSANADQYAPGGPRRRPRRAVAVRITAAAQVLF